MDSREKREKKEKERRGINYLKRARKGAVFKAGAQLDFWNFYPNFLRRPLLSYSLL